VAGVRIDTGPVDHDTPWEEVRPDRKFLILGAWQQFFHVDIKYDCRELLRIVEDMRANEAWSALGFADLEDLLRRGVEIDSELVGWAMRGLRVFDPNEPLPFETAVFVGRELMAHDEAGKRGGRGKKAIRNREGLSSDTVEYIKARLRRDDPALAARVERGELTANAAAVAKGWRKKRDPGRQLDKAWDAATPEQRAACVAKKTAAVHEPDGLEQLRQAWRHTWDAWHQVSEDERAAFRADHADELRRLLDGPRP
jgi:hypothetical protein